MLLLLVSQLFIAHPSIAYGVLLIATTSMGLAFGFTVPTINTYASQFFPPLADRAVLALNTLLGLGTALAPVIVSVFVGLGIWWGLPTGVAALTLGCLVFTVPLNLAYAVVLILLTLMAGRKRGKTWSALKDEDFARGDWRWFPHRNLCR